MTVTCNSRPFSRLTKSCFPDTTTTDLTPIPIPIPIRQPTFSFISLPDDLLLECLSRVSLCSLASLSLVCRKWSHLINSPAFHTLRRSRGLLRQTIFAISVTGSVIHVASLCSESNWNIASIRNMELLFSTSRSSLVSIGRHIYILNRYFTLRYDAWTGSFTSRSVMIFPRKKFAAGVVSGKIYISGGTARAKAIEEYDPKTDTWKIVTFSAKKRYGCIGASVDGVLYVIGGLKINTGMETLSSAREYTSSMDLYDVGTQVWLRSRSVPSGGCVVGGCAVGGHVYVLTSHAVELSFWRFDGRRKSGGFGVWCRMQSPPLPAQVRLDNTVRFCCVGVGEEKVVLVQVLGCIDDLLRRSGRSCKGIRDGLVLVYECECGEWSRGVDLPEMVTRAACVCVEC